MYGDHLVNVSILMNSILLLSLLSALPVVVVNLYLISPVSTVKRNMKIILLYMNLKMKEKQLRNQ